MQTCLNCYNSLMCFKYTPEKREKYLELGEGCPQWEDDQADEEEEDEKI